MSTLNDRNETLMKRTYRKLNIGEQGNKILSAATVVLLVFGATVTVSAQTGFQGDLKRLSITDASGVNMPPTANFTYTQNGNTFIFDAGGSHDADGNIVEYKWDFGDGNYGNGVSVSHTYATVTSVEVTLSILDNSKGITISRQKLSIGSCQTQSADVSYTYSGKFTPDIFDDVVWGQSFIPNKTGEIYSIKVVSEFIPDPSSAALTIRVGDNPNLSVNYDVEEKISLENYNSKDTVEIIFTKKPTMTSGVKKYFMIYNTGGYSSRFKLVRNNNSGYAGGTDYSSTTGLANVVAASGDLSFEVMVCD